MTTTTTINFTGQPHGSIAQIAYIVPDIEAAMRSYVARLNVGPSFVAGPFVPQKGVYRGTPITPRLTLALAYSGTTMIELIQQHDDGPSVFAETVKKRGYGFHHFGLAVREFDAELAAYLGKGYKSPFRIPRPWECASLTWTLRRSCPEWWNSSKATRPSRISSHRSLGHRSSGTARTLCGACSSHTVPCSCVRANWEPFSYFQDRNRCTASTASRFSSSTR